MTLRNLRRVGPTGERRSAGQALVEFAIVIPIFLLLFFGVVDGGRLVYMNAVLSQGAREGARLAAVEASWMGSSDSSCNNPGGPVCPSSIAALKNDVLAAVNRMVKPFGPITATNVYIACTTPSGVPTGSWTGQSCSNHAVNSVVSVRVQLEYRALTPIIGSLIPPTWLSGSATMVIN